MMHILASLLLLGSIGNTEAGMVSVEQKEASEIHPAHITYLIQSKDFQKGIDLYLHYVKMHGRHDEEVLQQIAYMLLEQAARSGNVEEQMLGVYSCALATVHPPIDILEAGIQSKFPQIQLTSIQIVGMMQDDRCEELLVKAMSSEFFPVRLEAAYYLALRKSRVAVGQIESLMYRLPVPMRCFFPELFALIGTSEAIGVLKHLMDDTYHQTRIEAILSAARHGRDDLLPIIRSTASHLNMAEQEACASALGDLKDLKSLNRLERLSHSKSANVHLAAYRALYFLGKTEVREQVEQEAKAGNLFAISVLTEIDGGEETLAELLKDDDLTIHFNAAIGLLRKKDPRSLPHLLPFLLRDSRDLGFLPALSLGNSIRSWKVISSMQHHQKEGFVDLQAVSIAVRELILREALELPEKNFLWLAQKIFDSKQHELIPLLVSLLENLQTPEAIQLLHKNAQTAGAPFLRTYCNLALFRLNQPGAYEERIKEWIHEQKTQALVRFRPVVPKHARIIDTTLEITPDEHSRLLIEIFEALADCHDEKAINILVNALKEGNAQNRCLIAGLLIRTLQ